MNYYFVLLICRTVIISEVSFVLPSDLAGLWDKNRAYKNGDGLEKRMSNLLKNDINNGQTRDEDENL